MQQTSCNILSQIVPVHLTYVFILVNIYFGNQELGMIFHNVSLFRVMTAILLLGNIEFVEADGLGKVDYKLTRRYRPTKPSRLLS